jgi:cysteine desulfurase
VIYLDHAATSPLRAEVRAAMEPWWGVPANPSSVHRAGRRAAAALEDARDEVAAFLGRPSPGVVFCSGATEALHLAVVGLVARHGRRVAAAGSEHPAVRGAIEAAGAVTVPLSVGADGAVDPGAAALADVAVLTAANHETGVRQDLGAALAVGVPWVVDATHAAGRIPLGPAEAAAAVVISAHKLGGPVGVGVCSLPSGDPFPAFLRGGAQERGRRAGTVDVAGAVGLAAACRVAAAEREARARRVAGLDERLRAGLRAYGGEPVGDWSRTVPGTTSVVFVGATGEGILGETLVQALDLAGIAVSSGAACASGSVEPSPVLRAMGHPHPRSGLRFSLGPATTVDEIDAALAALGPALARLRAG